MIEYLAALPRVFRIYPKKKMNTELQNKAWQVLPKEFKEEVKEIYANAVTHHPCGYNHKTDLLKYLFGNHNLTSDAKGEEMLIISRKEVQEQYQMYRNMGMIKRLDALMRLFGSKYLPDETSKKPSKKPNLSKCDTSWCENEL